MPLQFCKKAFPPCQTLIIYALLGNERRGETRGKHPEPVPSCRAFGMGFLSQVSREENKWGGSPLSEDGRTAPGPPPSQPLRWVDAAGRGGVKGHPRPRHTQEYLPRFWVSPDRPGLPEASPARLPWGEPPGLKSVPSRPSRFQRVEGQTKLVGVFFFSSLKILFLGKEACLDCSISENAFVFVQGMLRTQISASFLSGICFLWISPWFQIPAGISATARKGERTPPHHSLCICADQ